MIYFKPLTTPAEWAWMKERTHVIACEDSQGLVAHKNGTILAICVADSFGVDSCNVHMAIDNPFAIRHGFLTEIADHLFTVCGRDRIFGLVPDNNARALKLNKHIGFTAVAEVPDAIALGVGYVIMRMDKTSCRWLTKQEEAA